MTMFTELVLHLCKQQYVMMLFARNWNRSIFQLRENGVVLSIQTKISTTRMASSTRAWSYWTFHRQILKCIFSTLPNTLMKLSAQEVSQAKSNFLQLIFHLHMQLHCMHCFKLKNYPVVLWWWPIASVLAHQPSCLFFMKYEKKITLPSGCNV